MTVSYVMICESTTRSTDTGIIKIATVHLKHSSLPSAVHLGTGRSRGLFEIDVYMKHGMYRGSPMLFSPVQRQPTRVVWRLGTILWHIHGFTDA